jgi:hypothetical protein
MLALKGEHHGSRLAGLCRSPKGMEAGSNNDSAIRHADELTHPALSSRLVTLNKGTLFLQEQRGNVVENKGEPWKKPE